MLQAFALAFQDPQGQWSLDSIQRVLGDARFREAVLTTFALILLIIPVQFALAMAMSLIVNAKLKGGTLWLYVFALPLGISELAAGIIWFALLTEQGWFNSVLQQLGLIESPYLFLDYRAPWQLIVAVVVAEAWRATAIMMVILVAGLQGISKDLLEAADVYGATTWKKLWKVILPLLRPSLRVALILRTILAFQVFAAIIALTGRGLTVLANEAYRSYEVLREPRVAAAYAAVILVLSVISTLVIFLLMPSKEEQYRA